MTKQTPSKPTVSLPPAGRKALLFLAACLSAMAAALYLELSVMGSACLFLLIGIFFLYHRYGFHSERQIRLLALLSAAVCALSALLGRYSKYDDLFYGIQSDDFRESLPQQLLLTLFIAAGLFVFFYFCFLRLYEYSRTFSLGRTTAPPVESWVVFLCSFLIILVCWLPYYLTYFPGLLSNDSVWQMDQVLGIRPYSNHHPFTHTMMIKLVYTIGFAIFGTIRGGVAFYTFSQMAAMALIFSYLIYTVYRQGSKTGWCIALLAYFALMPFHAMYSITMWKDVLFGGFVLLFAISLWKLLTRYRSGEPVWSALAMFAVTGVFVSLLRTNGFLVFLLCIPVAVVILRKFWLPVLAAGVASVVVVLMVLGPVMSAFDVIPVDTVEALSIPLQHISRVIADEKPLTAEETALIEQLAPVEEIKAAYRPYISDPVKNLIRYYNNQEAFSTYKWEYLKLWVSLAVKYPWEIIKAQADQTYGYWYPDVQYWNVWTYMVANDFGLTETPLIDGPVSELVRGAGRRLYPVGRLDLNSEGLLIMTDDGEAANALMHPAHEVEKVYNVTVRGRATPRQAAAMEALRAVAGKPIRPARVQLLRAGEDSSRLRFVIHEGRNRQVRRMCESVGLTVTRLIRVAEGELTLGDLPSGHWRELTEAELVYVRGLVRENS